MYELKVTSHFSAAHSLREFDGRCENLHGHNWFVEVRARAPELDRFGLVLDFGLIKKRLHETLEELDHRHLNELPAFQTLNPSSENIARFIFDRLAPLIEKESAGRAGLYSVSAWESENTAATYTPGR